MNLKVEMRPRLVDNREAHHRIPGPEPFSPGTGVGEGGEVRTERRSARQRLDIEKSSRWNAVVGYF